MIEIPLPAYNPWFDLTVILDNQAWSLEFQYNFLMGRFVFSVLSPDGNPVISGVPLEINIPLTFQYQNSSYELPDGDFFYIGDEPPTPENLGIKGRLIFKKGGL